MSWKDKLRALLDDPELDDTTAADDPTENPEPIGKGEDPTTEVVEDAADAEGITETLDEDQGAETLPDSDQSPEALRDSLNRLAAENESYRVQVESLRTRIAELGGDAALGITEAEPEEEVVDEPADEYDDEKALADIDEQKAQIAKLRGNKD